MARSRRKRKMIYKYTCNITEEVYKTTREAPNPDDLVSVKGYYQLHPEKDDRPLIVKKEEEQNS